MFKLLINLSANTTLKHDTREGAKNVIDQISFKLIYARF